MSTRHYTPENGMQGDCLTCGGTFDEHWDRKRSTGTMTCPRPEAEPWEVDMRMEENDRLRAQLFRSYLHWGAYSHASRLFGGWDDIVPTAECLHCGGTGQAPGEGHTECGFCE